MYTLFGVCRATFGDSVVGVDYESDIKLALAWHKHAISGAQDARCLGYVKLPLVLGVFEVARYKTRL